ncbi:MAG: hypothetical protein EOM28_12265 [Clostridia bacterium]|nr:hypothetical protein [Clostridia bacterium]
MNRKKEIVIFIILIPLLLFSFMRLGGYYFTAEGVLYACERGLGYGPSEKILAEYELDEGGKLIVGKWEGNLSVIPAERAFGIFWKLKDGGVSGCIPCDKMVVANLTNDENIFGLTLNKEISEVYCRIEYGDYENPLIQEVTMAVNQEGYFYGISEIEQPEEAFIHIWYLEGRNSSGEVLYRDGVSAEGNYYNDGILNETGGKKE